MKQVELYAPSLGVVLMAYRFDVHFFVLVILQLLQLVDSTTRVHLC